MAVSASYNSAFRYLLITSDSDDNVVNISRELDGSIVINNGEVAISGGTPTASNTDFIYAFGFDGNDQIVLNEFNGALPRAYLFGGSGNDYLAGGSDNDLVRGGDNVDTLYGDSGNDVLLGDRGNDVVYGGTGSDLLIHNDGDGSDVLEGGEGFDFVQVNGSNAAGDDFSIEANGDRVTFQRNNLGLFTLDIGTVENLDVNGGGGSDVIIGSIGLNGLISLDLDGGAGNDLLIGGDGADVLRGGDDNDVLIGGRGNDIVLGQDGSDLLIVNNGDGSDFLEGGEGFDTVQVNGSNTAGDDFSIEANGNRVTFQRNNLSLFTLDIGTVENLDVNGGGGSDVIIGSTGLAGLIGLDLDGEAGNDLLIGGDGVDVLRGGEDNDVLIGGVGNDVMLGEEGADLLIHNNGDGSDFAEGGEGIDTLQVNASNTSGDEIHIDPNGSRVRVRQVNGEQFTLNVGTVENLDINGQGGSDVIIGSTGLNGLISLDLDGGEGNDLLIGGDGADVLRGGAHNDVLVGGQGNDIVLGQDGSDLLIVNDGDGSDFLEGGEGFDFVQVNGDNDSGDSFRIDANGDRVRFRKTNGELFTLDIGTTENLDVNGQGGSDVIIGTVGLNGLITLDLDGGEGNDLLIGGDGADVLRGGNHNDVLLGSRGNDIVLGQAGDDLIIVNTGDGSDFVEGGGGNDTLQVNGSNTESDVVTATANGNRVRIEGTGGSTYTLDVGTTETIDINTLGGNDRFTAGPGLAGLANFDIDGGLGVDILTGGDGNDTVRGGADTDLVRGGAGADRLEGNQGNDFVFGEDGNDLIVVNEGDGSDLIEGGQGRDTVQFSTGNLDDEVSLTASGRVARVADGSDTQTIGSTEVIDIQSADGNDTVTVGDLSSVEDLQTVTVRTGDGDDVINASNAGDGFSFIARGGEGDDIMLSGAGNDVLLGEEGRDILISNDGNDFVSGGDGNDILISGDGNDVLLGGEGNDLLSGGNDDDILLAGAGNDTLNGGDGIDFLDGGAGQDVFINGETVINGAVAAASSVSLADLSSGRARVVRDTGNEGPDTIANFEVGVDKIVVTGFDFARTKSGAIDTKSIDLDDQVRLSFDDDRAILSFDTDGKGDGGFQDQWIIEGENATSLTLNDIAGDLVFV